MSEHDHGELDVIRHSAAHVMAEAVLQMFPEAKFAIGPAIEDGFYYDFDLPRPLSLDDLKDIERRMREIIKGKHPFVCEVVSREQALALFAGQPYKEELIHELPEGEPISIYRQNGFTDLCRGPHVASTAELNPDAIKLLSIAGAYWRGDEKRPMLQRIYGTAWRSREELAAYLKRQEEIEARDHRRLGRQLDLFSVHEEAGAGLIYWHPNGGRIRTLVEDFWRQEHYANGYDILYTPHIGKSWLWETSGHLGFYAENMYAPMAIDNIDYYIKPMNCPFHILIYKTQTRSYRDLPLRWAELGTVYRYERSGVLHGLLRVRGFTQDDAHIFCTPEQIETEILRTLRFSLHLWHAFGFDDIKAYLATRPLEKSVGEQARWDQATASLRKALEEERVPYEIDEGGGAFYGPKIDLKIRDALGREWQMTTIQFDFNEPELFDMTYAAEDGTPRRPYMVHRALLGSLERFFGVLIEHYGGAFPVWLQPLQAKVIPIADRHLPYAEQVELELRQAGLRAAVDRSSDRLNAKIRNAQLLKIPYMLVVGDREAEQHQVAVRLRTEENLGAMALDEFIARAKQVVADKRGL
ncbi:MAG TPA: threonine--tRNA ligase [Anaerolineae bacterium]|nr:threonine--tRNA ligase [Anaerolineae bacterium]HPL27458.1 threonine--tRNA ligase [Anaerolineae bacterium]